MEKDKNDKINKFFLDAITQNRLKWLVILFIVLSFICEFFPSMFNICKIFNYCPLVVFLQPHKDFFTNIILGCLGSSIISYIVLQIPNKLIDEYQQKVLSDIIKKIIYNYVKMYNTLYNIIKKEDGRIYSIELEENFKMENQNLFVLIKELKKYKMEFDIKSEMLDKIVKLCDEKLIPIIQEINDFFYILETNINLCEIKDDEILKKLKIEMYVFLLENLKNNYNFDGIKEELTSIVPETVVGILQFYEISKDMTDFLKLRTEYRNRLVYSSKFILVCQDAFEDAQKEDIEKIKERIINNVHNNPDSLKYGEKSMEGDKVVYIVNGKNMSTEKYKQYCIQKEFERRGITL